MGFVAMTAAAASRKSRRRRWTLSQTHDGTMSERASVGSEVSDFVRGNADVTVTFMTAGKKPTDIHEMHEKD